MHTPAAQKGTHDGAGDNNDCYPQGFHYRVDVLQYVGKWGPADIVLRQRYVLVKRSYKGN
ncbi:unnamed protein product [marine sediment metagenome]|uniref:Uncharacterized protein n=1 Tax=marine sediment metagenome TaxID=412755 RepID=X1IQ40_9ZZZZ